MIYILLSTVSAIGIKALSKLLPSSRSTGHSMDQLYLTWPDDMLISPSAKGSYVYFTWPADKLIIVIDKYMRMYLHN